MNKYHFNERSCHYYRVISILLAWITVCFATCRSKALTRAAHQYRTYFRFPLDNSENIIIESATAIDILNETKKAQLNYNEIFRTSSPK